MGANPYMQQMAGILNSILAQNAAAATAQNNAQSSKGGLLNQMSSYSKLFNKNNSTTQTQAATNNATTGATPLIPQNVVTPDVDEVTPQASLQVAPTNYTPATPSKGFQEMLPQLMDAAKQAYPDNHTMQKVALSQAVLESGLTGKPSALATQNNNYFGIKASRSFPGTAGTVDYGTTEYIGGQPSNINQGFAANNSMLDSFKQHANLMQGASRYQPVMQAQSPEDAFAALQSAGYATDPNYANKLNSIYGQYIAPAYGT
jgi:peptidoglycan hydrolase FlgJ